jgi:glycosyltransferase involved in cell wall biosynthesis
VLHVSVLSQMDPASPRTNSIADLRLCSGLAAQGHHVELVVPALVSPRPTAEALFATYGLEPSFAIRYLEMTAAGVGYRDSRIYLPLLRQHALEVVRSNRTTVVVSRGIRMVLPYVLVYRARFRRIVAAPWIHEFRGKRLERFVLARSTCLLATNSAIVRDLAEARVPSPPSFVTGNPVPGERVEFGREFTKADARNRLGLDGGQTVIAYTGKLYLGMKELEYLLAAAARMPECLFLFTGGQPHVIAELTGRLEGQGISNVRLAGLLKEPEETRYYQQAADVLVTYYSTVDHPYAHHNLPGKVAEYMVTGNPIVSADFPAVRDLLNPGNSILVEPDDVDALVNALERAVRERAWSAALGRQAQRDVAGRTTESLGSELGAFLSSLGS